MIRLAGAAAPDDVASRFELTIEIMLFVAAGILTLIVLAVFVFGVLRHAGRDGEGRIPTDSDDRGAA